MTKPIIRIHDTSTDEVIDREMTDAEFAIYESKQADHATEKAEAQTKAQAKATAEAKLSALGLTTDDLRALGL